MKKTIIALLALSGVTTAATTSTFTDLLNASVQNGITYSSGTFTGAISTAGGDGVAESAIAMTLNLTAINNYLKTNTASVTLMTFDVDTNVGLALTSEGIKGMWNDVVWNNGNNFTIAYNDLPTTWVGNDGNTYTTIAVSHANIQGIDGGTMVYSGSSKLGGYNGLGSTNNDNMTAIEVDTTYVISAAISNGWTASSAAQTLVNSLAASTKAITGVVTVPEPTTATLSLLALAGLAVRRRRK